MWVEVGRCAWLPIDVLEPLGLSVPFCNWQFYCLIACACSNPCVPQSQIDTSTATVFVDHEHRES